MFKLSIIKVIITLNSPLSTLNSQFSTLNSQLNKIYFFCVFENEYGASLSAVPRCLFGSDAMS